MANTFGPDIPRAMPKRPREPNHLAKLIVHKTLSSHRTFPAADAYTSANCTKCSACFGWHLDSDLPFSE